MIQPNTFSKSEHLCGEKHIGSLYTEGTAFIVYPLRVVYLIKPKNEDELARVMVSVPKKRFKRAVKRNRLKRLIREAYRLNKHLLLEKLNENEMQIHIAFNYVSDAEFDFTSIEKKMKVVLHKLIENNELSDSSLSL